MLQPTQLALLFITAVLVQATNLSGLLFVSMVLQAGSVLNIATPAAMATQTSAYGVTPFHAMGLVVVLAGLWRLLRGPLLHWPRHLNLPLSLLAGYSIIVLAGSWWLPRWFDGLPVHSAIQMYGVYSMSPLSWNFGHAVQSINLVLLLCVLAAVWVLCQSQLARIRLLTGLALGCAVVLVIGGYEQLAPHFGMQSVTRFWANNPGYHQVPIETMGILHNRIGLPFSEPSYASVYLATMMLGFTAVTLLGHSWWWSLPAAWLCALGLINTLGSTGLVGGAVALVVLLIWVVWGALRPCATWARRIRAALLCAAVLFSSFILNSAYEASPMRSNIDLAVTRLILNKVNGEGGSAKIRANNNQRAIEIVAETHGLGVGMGSHRASSFFASLLANTGILGFVLFMVMLASLLWRYWRAPVLSDSQIFVAAALPTATLAMGVGIPDLNLPMYWGFIILAFVFCPDDAQMISNTFKTLDLAVADQPLESRA